ncbi:DUF3455 domain-containing protein [Kutzneria sp. CA-103260]|uniref:DUF3455 domain-containing protein n=1 Tax=Kutzneria sp. CA-103260 TaxID=2802641 RepID=UPI001BABF92D|nr:DUF3455 domain-containing protein [Kutzneria sp. CA-103260]QUQ70781.1 hypothetical protein JJ691_85640 [Kutzneria sp. CA-103260]
MNRVTTALALVSALATVGVAANSAPQPEVKPVAQQEVPAPVAVKVPAGNRMIATFDGRGVQIYTCANAAWTLLEPAATLSDHGKPVALHFKGPIWVSTVDGSEVGAAAVPGASAPRPGAVPELLLKATENHGKGQFSDVTYVQRLATRGGLAPAGPCTDGAQVSTPYSATYVFWAAAR